jgi:hypothetical protein
MIFNDFYLGKAYWRWNWANKMSREINLSFCCMVYPDKLFAIICISCLFNSGDWTSIAFQALKYEIISIIFFIFLTKISGFLFKNNNKNPRLPSNFNNKSENDIIEWMLEDESIIELMSLLLKIQSFQLFIFLF